MAAENGRSLSLVQLGQGRLLIVACYTFSSFEFVSLMVFPTFHYELYATFFARCSPVSERNCSRPDFSRLRIILELSCFDSLYVGFRSQCDIAQFSKSGRARDENG